MQVCDGRALGVVPVEKPYQCQLVLMAAAELFLALLQTASQTSFEFLALALHTLLRNRKAKHSHESRRRWQTEAPSWLCDAEWYLGQFEGVGIHQLTLAISQLLSVLHGQPLGLRAQLLCMPTI